MAWWRSARGRVRIPTMSRKDFDEPERFGVCVADFLRAWAVARHQTRETRPRQPSEPWLLAWGDQWRTVLALSDADTETMTMIVLAITRWAFREGFRAGLRSGLGRRRNRRKGTPS